MKVLAAVGATIISELLLVALAAKIIVMVPFIPAFILTMVTILFLVHAPG